MGANKISKKVEAVSKLLQSERTKSSVRSMYYAQPVQFHLLYIASQVDGVEKKIETDEVKELIKLKELRKERKALIEKIKGEDKFEVYSAWETRVKDIELEIKKFDKRRK